jgi:NIMA-interacting peptidyl-prolyl cis-trans isomerase 1
MSWVVRESSKRPGVPYYFNRSTGESTWEKPPGFVTAAEVDMEEVRASHILVKHVGSRRPSSWRCPTVTLTKEQAIEKLNGIREQIVSGKQSFEGWSLAASSTLFVS